MHGTQEQILALAKSNNLAKMTLREIADAVQATSAQAVQYHLDQLVKRELLWIDRRAGTMRLLTGVAGDNGLLRIPVYGAASCGPALLYADAGLPEDYLIIAESLLGLNRAKAETYFGVRAVGDSMNEASIPSFGGRRLGIDDGDMVIVEKTIPDSASRPYILAIIDGLANIKRLVLGDGVARLESESTARYLPIYIDPAQAAFIAGKVVAVVKG